MIEDMNKIIDNVFEETKIKNEAKKIIELASKTKKHIRDFQFIKNKYLNGNGKSLQEISNRIDYIKSFLIKSGSIQKNNKDYFGNIEIIEPYSDI